MSSSNISSLHADYLRMQGAQESIFAIGDCTATSYAPTAQVASQQGAYLARILGHLAKKDNLKNKLHQLESTIDEVKGEEDKKAAVAEIESVRNQLSKIKLRPFHYSHQGSLA